MDAQATHFVNSIATDGREEKPTQRLQKTGLLVGERNGGKPDQASLSAIRSLRILIQIN